MHESHEEARIAEIKNLRRNASEAKTDVSVLKEDLKTMQGKLDSNGQENTKLMLELTRLRNVEVQLETGKEEIKNKAEELRFVEGTFIA